MPDDEQVVVLKQEQYDTGVAVEEDELVVQQQE